MTTQGTYRPGTRVLTHNQIFIFADGIPLNLTGLPITRQVRRWELSNGQSPSANLLWGYDICEFQKIFTKMEISLKIS
jgi:hypothetical protein